MEKWKCVDMVGQQFGMLFVVSRAENRKNKAHWNCICDCGKASIVCGANLRNGASRSCGCQHVNRLEAARSANIRHGLLCTPTYHSWQSMIARCYRPSHKSFDDYGGRGIYVCDEWRTFVNFLSDMGIRPDGTTIEREDNFGHYEPGNCVWATRNEQARNRRSSRYLTVFEETKTIVEWSEDERCVPSHGTLRKRVENGWDALDALTRPVAPKEMAC